MQQQQQQQASMSFCPALRCNWKKTCKRADHVMLAQMFQAYRGRMIFVGYIDDPKRDEKGNCPCFMEK